MAVAMGILWTLSMCLNLYLWGMVDRLRFCVLSRDDMIAFLNERLEGK